MFGYVPDVTSPLAAQTPCALHDLWPCALCNGDQAKLDASLDTPRGDYEPGTRIAPGVVASEFPGICAGCGLNYGIGSPIRWTRRGYQATGCCG